MIVSMYAMCTLLSVIGGTSLYVAGMELGNEWQHRIVAIDGDAATYSTYYTDPACVLCCSVFVNQAGGTLAYGTGRGDETDDSLYLLDMERKESRLIEQRVAMRSGLSPWSPDGKMLAYMTCTNPGGTPKGTGVWLYDVASGRKEKIRDSAARIAWTPSGNRLYVVTFENKSLLVYDVSTKCWTESPLMDLYVSPNGRYYAVYEEDLLGVNIFTTSNNAPLWRDLLSIWREPTDPHWCGTHFYLLNNMPWPKQAILDCEKGIVYEAPGEVIQIVDHDRDVLYWKRDEKILNKKPIRELRILAPRKEEESKAPEHAESNMHRETPDAKPQP